MESLRHCLFYIPMRVSSFTFFEKNILYRDNFRFSVMHGCCFSIYVTLYTGVLVEVTAQWYPYSFLTPLLYPSHLYLRLILRIDRVEARKLIYESDCILFPLLVCILF